MGADRPRRGDGARAPHGARSGAPLSGFGRPGARRAAAKWLGLLAGLGFAALGSAAELEPAPDAPDAREIARRADHALRGDHTYIQARMTVTTPRRSEVRVVSFHWWDDRPRRRTLIRVLSPATDAGTSFLKLHPNLWMYAPRAETTLLLPPSLRLRSWLGSDFTHDDLLRETSEVDDYDHRLLGLDPRPGEAPEGRAWVLESTPRAGGAAPWPRIVSWIETDHGTPLRREYYGAKGEAERVVRFDDVREVGDRRVPHRWTVTPLRHPGRESRIELEALRFDAPFDEGTFSPRRLKAPD